jgi:hypothetical protein
MEKEFIPYDLALRMKQLGFNEYCFAGYRHSKWIGSDGPNSRYFHAQQFRNSMFDEKQNEDCSSPLYQQAFRWFREKYKFNHSIIFHKHPFGTDDYQYLILLDEDEFLETGFKTHEEAEQDCLVKLIDIIENK